MNYHDSNGYPIVNKTRFPDLKSMVGYAHALNLTAGFYGNNCICSDKCRNETECDMQTLSDVKAFLSWGFDSWKLDGCGGQNDLSLFDKYIRQLSKKPIVVENCHWGEPVYDPIPSLPPRKGCPFNFYRTSGDIQPSYQSILSNLASVEKYKLKNESVPQCWAYPDMLQVGVIRKDYHTLGLSTGEARTHFGAWCIVSSPLILSHDVNDQVVSDQIWDIISNREAIAVNQAYAGDSGGVYDESSTKVCINDRKCGSSWNIRSSMRREVELKSDDTVPSYRYLSKQLGIGKSAVLLVNSANEAATLTAKVSDIPGLLPCKNGEIMVRNIWTHTDEGSFVDSWSALVEGHDAAFIIVECEIEEVSVKS